MARWLGAMVADEQAFKTRRACTGAAAHPTAAVRHGGRLTGRATTRLRSGSRRGVRVSWRIPVFQPAPSRGRRLLIRLCLRRFHLGREGAQQFVAVHMVANAHFTFCESSLPGAAGGRILKTCL
jgi:hypothetical protein